MRPSKATVLITYPSPHDCIPAPWMSPPKLSARTVIRLEEGFGFSRHQARATWDGGGRRPSKMPSRSGVQALKGQSVAIRFLTHPYYQESMSEALREANHWIVNWTSMTWAH